MAGAPRHGFALVLLLGVISGIAASAIPGLAGLETSVGLHWLFNLRGERTPPDDVVLLGISRESARMLDLPSNPRKWPRDRHAQMVDLLRQAGARVVVFDVMFEEARDPNRDRAMAEAMQHAGNVVLFQYLERDLLSASAGTLVIDVQRTRDPLPILAEAAAGVAPFPLPNLGARVNHLWLFKRDAGDAPTMPAVALQQFAQPHLPAWLALLRTALNDSNATAAEPGPAAADPLQALMAHVPDGTEPDAARLTAATRTLFLERPALASRLHAALGAMHAAELAPDARRCLAALIQLYSAPNSRTLDHYGSAGSIRTIAYHRLLDGPDQLQAELRDRAVFVGYIETLQQEQKDSFRTVFSRPESPQVAGVEIAATALANLLEQRVAPAWPVAARVDHGTGQPARGRPMAGWGLGGHAGCGRHGRRLAGHGRGPVRLGRALAAVDRAAPVPVAGGAARIPGTALRGSAGRARTYARGLRALRPRARRRRSSQQPERARCRFRTGVQRLHEH